jgi:hypothetical protein
MAGLVPAIHVLLAAKKDVDARHRRQVYAVCARQTTMAGHDDSGWRQKMDAYGTGFAKTGSGAAEYENGIMMYFCSVPQSPSGECA